MKKPNILIIAGEPSGDMRAGEVIKELRALLPDVSFWGIGGDLMSSRGVELIEHVRNLSIVGIWEVIKNIFRIREQFRMTLRAVDERRPDLAILVDYPGFNLEIAKHLKKRDIPVIYYVIPQVWAWGEHRVKTIKSCVAKALVLFPFEERFLADRGVNAEFTGHPLLDRMPDFKASDARPVREDPVVALLPGSRKSEVGLLFPVLLETAEFILSKKPGARFVVAESSGVDTCLYDIPLSQHPSLSVERVKDNTPLALSSSDMAIVASGTATLEVGLMEKPMIITYKAPLLLSPIYRLFVRTPYLGLVNIISAKEVVPEFLQDGAEPSKMAAALLDIYYDDSKRNEMLNALKEVKRALGSKGAAKRTARAIADFYLRNRE